MHVRFRHPQFRASMLLPKGVHHGLPIDRFNFVVVRDRDLGNFGVGIRSHTNRQFLTQSTDGNATIIDLTASFRSLGHNSRRFMRNDNRSRRFVSMLTTGATTTGLQHRTGLHQCVLVQAGWMGRGDPQVRFAIVGHWYFASTF